MFMSRQKNIWNGPFEWRGRRLAFLLNDKFRPDEKARIEKILVLLQALQERINAIRKLCPKKKTTNGPYFGELALQDSELINLERSLDEATAGYQTRPRFIVHPSEQAIGVVHLWQRSLEQTEAFQLIEFFLKTNKLNKLTKCATCKDRWVFRARAKWRYCEDVSCRQAPYEKTDKRKKDKKANSYQNYWKEEERAERNSLRQTGKKTSERLKIILHKLRKKP
jgi:thiol:disulfide interchange protein